MLGNAQLDKIEIKTMLHKTLKVNPTDNVIVALRDLAAGEVITHDGIDYTLTHDVGAKHKFVTENLNAGDAVMMYGVLVGRAKQPIVRGEMITTFNLKHDSEDYSIAKRQPYSWTPPDVSKWKGRTFRGYRRSDGKVGTYNYWLVLPLVFCENRNILILKDAFERELGYSQPDMYRDLVRSLVNSHWSLVGKAGVGSQKSEIEGQELGIRNQEINTSNFKFQTKNQEPSTTNYELQTKNQELSTSNYELQTSNQEPSTKHSELSTSNYELQSKNRIFENIDGIKFLTHEGGCGGTRHDANTLCALFAAYAVHPNVAGITVLSLGCQNAEVKTLNEEIQKRSPAFDKPLLIFEQQDGTEFAMMSAAIHDTFIGLVAANGIEREDVPISELVLGLKCGGSDGFSGISANPVLGRVSDILVALGGKTILAEFPELHGVEQELLNRCVSDEKAAKFERLMRDYSSKVEAVGSSFAFNPSPGNIKDGLITDAIKSAGAAKKGGGAPIQDVTNYAEISDERGLQLACTPGNDVEATTGKTAAGATVIVFTTGLGTPTGNPICPVVKASTNSKLAKKMPDVIDFDCGPVISGEQTIEQNADDMLELIIKIASGQQLTQAQRLAQDDFIPWKRGVSL
jgi:altronate hydrolase